MKTLEIQDATASLADYVREANKQPVIVSRKGKPIAALVPIQNADWETASLSTNPQFLAFFQHSRIRQQREGGLSSVEMRGRVGLSGKGLTRRSSRR